MNSRQTREYAQPHASPWASASNFSRSTCGFLARASSVKFQASACDHSWSNVSTAIVSFSLSLNLITNRSGRRMHSPRFPFGSQLVRTITGFAAGQVSRSWAKTCLKWLNPKPAAKLTREAPKLPGSKSPRQAGSLIRQAMTGALERARFMATLSIAPAGRSASPIGRFLSRVK